MCGQTLLFIVIANGAIHVGGHRHMQTEELSHACIKIQQHWRQTADNLGFRADVDTSSSVYFMLEGHACMHTYIQFDSAALTKLTPAMHYSKS